MKLSMLEKCFNYCSRLFTSITPCPYIYAPIKHITDIELPPNGSLELVDPILSADLLFFTTQPFCLKHLNIYLPIIQLHHCEDILRLCPYLWSLTITTDSIPDFETLLFCCEPGTHLRLIYKKPQTLSTLEDSIKIAKKFTHAFIEGIGFCSNLQCDFRFQIRNGTAYAWLPDIKPT
uniref:Uncharacterized protein n=1 Tax=Panagrolaimus davidi TaxID=227884 RepID=A0A914NZN8_9BILA